MVRRAGFGAAKKTIGLMTDLPMRVSMSERRAGHRMSDRTCPVCRQPAARGCKSCNRPRCVDALRRHRIRETLWVGGQKYVDPELLKSDGPAICPHCRGAKWFLTRDGVAWEGCDGVSASCPWEAPIPVRYLPRERSCRVSGCTKGWNHSGAHTRGNEIEESIIDLQ